MKLRSWQCAALVSIFLTGCTGGDGKSSLVRLDDEPPGVNCPRGGTAIHSGIDDNGDGQLADDEIGSTSYVCADSGLTTLVRIEAEPAGANCADGGTAIKSGLDLDGDGVLADTEVTTTAYVCNDPATSTLVRVDNEPAGLNCEYGGSAVHVGVDADDDGILDDPEITDTTYVCNGADGTGTAPSGTLEGNYVIENSLDAVLISGYSAITGNLSVESAALTGLQLPALASIGGSFTMVGAAALVSLDLPALTSVGGDVTILANASLSAITVPQLATIDGTLVVDSNAELPNLDGFGMLDTLGGALTINANAKLTSISGLGALTSLGGNVTVSNNTLLASLAGLAGVTTFASDAGVTITSNAALVDVDGLVGLTTTTGDISITGNDVLADLDGLANLTSARNLTVNLNPMLTDMTGLAALQNVAVALAITQSPMTSLALSALQTANDFTIAGNAALTSLAAPMLVSADTVTINNNTSLTTLDLTNLQSVSNSLELTGNNMLATLAGLSALGDVQFGLIINGNAILADVNLPTLQSVGSITITNNPNLTSLAGISNVNTLTGTFTVTGNPLSSVLIPGLSYLTETLDLTSYGASAWGIVDVSSEVTITSFSLPDLAASLDITSYDVSLSAPKLYEVTGDLSIYNSPDLDISGLFALYGTLNITATGATSLLFLNLLEISSFGSSIYVIIRNSTNLTNLKMPGFTSFNGVSVEIANNPSLPVGCATDITDVLITNGFTGAVDTSGNAPGACP